MVSEPVQEPAAEAGPPTTAAALRIVRERGPMTRQVKDAVLGEGGAHAWEDLLTSLSPACRERFRGPVGYFEWVDSKLALELHAAWTARRGADFMAQRGEDAAREILGGAHRWMLRLATPGLLVHAFPKLYAFYYAGGLASVDALELEGAELSLQAWGYPEAWFRDAVPAWLKVALECTGTHGVAITYQAPEPDGCRHRYSVRWQG